MMPYCRHMVWFGYNGSCSTCIEEDLAEEISSIDHLIGVYQNLHDAIDDAAAKRFIPARDRSKDAVDLGYQLWRKHSRAWWSRHGQDHDLGGEA